MPLNLIAQYVPIVASLLLLAFGGYFYIQFNKANNLYKGNEAATPFSLLEARNRRLALLRFH